MNNYYKIKYLVTESFYEFIVCEKYDIDQAVGRCKVDFMDKILGKKMDSLIIYSTLLERIAKHDNSKLKSYLGYYNEMMSILEVINLDDYLNEDEKEAFTDDIDYIKSFM